MGRSSSSRATYTGAPVTAARLTASLGRAVLADPAWASKLADARLGEIRPYDKSAGSVLY